MCEIVGSIVTFYAFDPLRSAVVAVMFTISLFIPKFSVFLKMTIGLAATSWERFFLARGGNSGKNGHLR